MRDDFGSNETPDFAFAFAKASAFALRATADKPADMTLHPGYTY
jgi:hypothetical protein